MNTLFWLTVTRDFAGHEKASQFYSNTRCMGTKSNTQPKTGLIKVPRNYNKCKFSLGPLFQILPSWDQSMSKIVSADEICRREQVGEKYLFFQSKCPCYSAWYQSSIIINLFTKVKKWQPQDGWCGPLLQMICNVFAFVKCDWLKLRTFALFRSQSQIGCLYSTWGFSGWEVPEFCTQ